MARIAHSSDQKRGIPEQGYKEHVVNVVGGCLGRARRMLMHRTSAKPQSLRSILLRVLYLAAAFHDLGKLSHGFQRFLKTGGRDKTGHIRHEDAGVVALLESGHTEAALLVSCHHQGLIDLGFDFTDKIRSEDFRVPQHDNATRNDTDANWSKYLSEQKMLAGGNLSNKGNQTSVDEPLTRRLLLSCLVDSDHTDTARHYGQHAEMAPLDGRWAERIDSLNRYIKGLEAKAALIKDEAQITRNQNRAQLYLDCMGPENVGFTVCDAPVGSGKTTAVMARLLRIAELNEVRHIIVVLPFTNIIRQSVQVYRSALVLAGEKPEEVVAEHHHQVEFEDEALRHLTTLWQAPIIVTTAVQFFETLAASNTGRLRKLHELPGSCIFVDEAHAAMPAKFLPLAWKWMTTLQNRWNCHFVLASGSLARFWELESFQKILGDYPPQTILHLGSSNIRETLLQSERSRVQIQTEAKALSGTDLIAKIVAVRGPRIVVLNTVHSAALLAKRLAETGRRVLHLSTALAPCHRAIIVQRINEMLKHQSDWTLVATSLVEAGMDFSFRNGLRERASTASLIQLGGRVNRNAEWNDSVLLDFRLNDEAYPSNPGLEGSIFALGELIKRKAFDHNSQWSIEALCKEALNIEFSQKRKDEAVTVFGHEECERYAVLSKEFRLISADTRTVVIDRELVRRLESFEKVERMELIQKSIQLRYSKISNLALPGIRGRSRKDELFCLPSSHFYDPDFLGYMAGIFENDSAKIPSGYCL